MQIWRRRLGRLLLAVLLISAFPVFRIQAQNDRKVVDEADLLSETEEEELQNQLLKIAEQYQCDVVVMTLESIGGKNIQSYADSCFYYKGYGYGDEESGILFLITMEERQFRLATRGEACDIFTDYGLEIIDDAVTGYLSDGNYYKAFSKFASLADAFMKEAANGRPYDVDHTYKAPMATGVRLLISLGAGLAAALIVTGILFAQLKSVRAEREAWEYIRDGSFHLTRQRDIFLYRTVTRRRIERENRAGGGGSTIHSSPGGGRSGGRTGSF